jgi:hypothetical protein
LIGRPVDFGLRPPHRDNLSCQRQILVDSSSFASCGLIEFSRSEMAARRLSFAGRDALTAPDALCCHRRLAGLPWSGAEDPVPRDSEANVRCNLVHSQTRRRPIHSLSLVPARVPLPLGVTDLGGRGPRPNRRLGESRGGAAPPESHPPRASPPVPEPQLSASEPPAGTLLVLAPVA